MIAAMDPRTHKHHLWPVAVFAVLALGVLFFAITQGEDQTATSGGPSTAVEVSEFCTPNEPAPDFDPDEIIGLTFAEAIQWGIDNDHPIRPVVIDGEPQAVTADLAPDRVNVQVDEERVTAYCGSY